MNKKIMESLGFKKEVKPILFSTSMVQDLLSGNKTATRRPVCANGKARYKKSDILYVREAWAKISDWTIVDPDVGMPDSYIYRADWSPEIEQPRWRPSIHMPKAAARLFLEVTNVKFEQLWDITEAGAIAEGFSDRFMFMAIWDAIYKNSLSNPTVEVVDFIVRQNKNWDGEL